MDCGLVSLEWAYRAAERESSLMEKAILSDGLPTPGGRAIKYCVLGRIAAGMSSGLMRVTGIHVGKLLAFHTCYKSGYSDEN